MAREGSSATAGAGVSAGSRVRLVTVRALAGVSMAMFAAAAVALGIQKSLTAWSSVLWLVGLAAAAASVIATPQEKQRGVHEWRWLVVGCALLGIAAGSCYGSWAMDPPRPACEGLPYSEAWSRVGAGDAVTAGNLGLVVASVRIDDEAGTGLAGRAAYGQWLVVEVEAENRGSSQERFDPGRLTLRECDPAISTVREWRYRTYSQHDGPAPTKVNPGLVASSTVVFDVPTDFPQVGWAFFEWQVEGVNRSVVWTVGGE